MTMMMMMTRNECTNLNSYGPDFVDKACEGNVVAVAAVVVVVVGGVVVPARKRMRRMRRMSWYVRVLIGYGNDHNNYNYNNCNNDDNNNGSWAVAVM
mmetsp:Transcript_18848/g.24473  ORF Transcript_18848/g.24473 Transcript_18848/m.24473 type:complete len:97 (+) Transcript_18848:1702-1992(+)